MENEEEKIREVLEKQPIHWLHENVLLDVFWFEALKEGCNIESTSMSNFLRWHKCLKLWPVVDLVNHLLSKSRASVCGKGFYMVLTPPYGLQLTDPPLVPWG